MSYRMIYTLRRLMCDKFSILCTLAELNEKQLRNESEDDTMKVNVRVKKAHPSVNIPQYQTELAAGFDIEAFIESGANVTIPVGERRLIGTGLHFQLPPSFELQLRPRSGLALKNGISLTNSPATIDADYTGEVKVILENRGGQPFVVENGMRICQGVIKLVEKAHFTVVEELSETERGSGGFGSTNVKPEPKYPYTCKKCGDNVPSTLGGICSSCFGY